MLLKQLHTLLPLLIFIFSSLLITAQASFLCNRRCGDLQFPYPFGFSSGCQIHLNCSSNGQIFVNDQFPVQSVTEDKIKINLKPSCRRPIQAFENLFTRNFAPKSSNAILWHNCSSKSLTCDIPSINVQTQLPDELFKCSTNGNMSCLFNRTTEGSFHRNDTRIHQCRNLLSSISSEVSFDHSVSLNIQVMELGWWLVGDCQCSDQANCTTLESSTDYQERRYRCQCKDGYEGDGYAAGSGCRKDKSNTNKGNKIGISTAAAATIVGICFGFCYCFIRRRRLIGNGESLTLWANYNKKQDKKVESFITKYHSLMPKRYTYSDIKKITTSFADKLGQGGYGGVYKGKLPDGRFVAIKILDKSAEDGEEFINEVATISRTSHVNVVALLGFCYERTIRALIYEYMPNRSLDKFIIYQESHQLDWKILHDIAIGIARGLEYLHRGCKTRIVHFDIKPHNILLDENFCPKISDFGLAKLYKGKESMVSMLGVRGTAGYIAPEIFMRSLGGVFYKSDVYSYGMMILEIFGGKNNSHVGVSQTSEMYFPDWIYKDLEFDIISRLDRTVTEEE